MGNAGKGSATAFVRGATRTSRRADPTRLTEPSDNGILASVLCADATALFKLDCCVEDRTSEGIEEPEVGEAAADSTGLKWSHEGTGHCKVVLELPV